MRRRERRRRRVEEKGEEREEEEEEGKHTHTHTNTHTHLPLLPLRFILGMASLLSTSWSKEEVGSTRVCFWEPGVPPLLSLRASSNMCGR